MTQASSHLVNKLAYIDDVKEVVKSYAEVTKENQRRVIEEAESSC